MRLTGLVNFKPLKEGGDAPKKEASYPETQVRNDLGTDSLHEAESVEYTSLSPADKKQVDTLIKIVGGKRFEVFDGVHGKILYIKVPPTSSGYRFDVGELKGLISAKIRWVEGGKEYVTIGF